MGHPSSENLLNNEQLVVDAGLRDEHCAFYDIVPYTKGYGFSAKRRYSPEALKNVTDEADEKDYFAFLSVSIFPEVAEPNDDFFPARIEVSLAHPPSKFNTGNSVVLVEKTSANRPLRVSDEKLMYNFRTGEFFSDEEAPISLRGLVDKFWDIHLAPTSLRSGCLLRIQYWKNHYRTFLVKNLLRLLEALAWVVSGSRYTFKEEDSENTVSDSISDVDVKRAYRSCETADLGENHEEPNCIEPSPSSISFQGINASVHAVFAYYILVSIFYAYKYFTSGAGPATFIDAYLNLLVFAAPLVLLIFGWVTPKAGYWIIKRIYRYYRNCKRRRASIRKLLGHYYIKYSKPAEGWYSELD